MRYANLSPGSCRKELRRRGLPVKAEKKAKRGIANPVRLSGAMLGVTYLTAPAPSVVGLLDCRLALVLDDMAPLLASFDVKQIHIGSMYRKGARIATSGRRSQHAYGLALDITWFRMNDGRLLRVERDWHAAIGEQSCGPNAIMTDPNEDAIALRNIVCAIARKGLFHHLLTPGSNRAHHDHLHFDIKRGVNYQSLK